MTILRTTSGYEAGPFPIDTNPPVGGQLDYYPYWELSLKRNITIYRNGSNSTTSPLPIWSDSLGFGGVLASCSDDGHYVVAGSDMGIVRLYDNSGAILWTYQVPGKPVGYVKITNDGSLVTAAYYYDSPSPPQSVSSIIRFDRNGSIIWKFIPDGTLRAIATSDDGNYVYASWDNDLSIINKEGIVVAKVNLSEPVGLMSVSGDGSTCVVAGYRGIPGKISVIDNDGTVLFTSPVETAVAGIGVSNDGELDAVIDDHTLFVFSRDGRTQWNFTSGPQFKSVSVSSDGNHAAAGSQYYLSVFNRTGLPEWRYENINPLTHTNNEWITSISLSSDGQFTGAGISDKIVLFNSTGKPLWQYSSPEWMTGLKLSGEGNYLAATSLKHVYYFNREGNATNSEPERTQVISYEKLATPQTTPISIWLAIIGGACAGIIIMRRKGN